VRIVYLGSGAFGIPCLEALVRTGHQVTLVVAQPDREKGRGRALAAPPLKAAALDLGLPVLQPTRIKAPDAVAALAAERPELQVVVAYGQILPRSVIDLAPLGAVNVHASLLPLYRGAAPIQWAIANGAEVTGVTTMLIDDGLDTGPTLLAQSTEIGPEETASELEARLAPLGADVLLRTIAGLAAGTLTATPQDHAAATLAPILDKEHGRIRFAEPARAVHDHVRGMTPWPGAFTTASGKTLKILESRIGSEAGQSAPPGTVVRAGKSGIDVACGAGTLSILRAQLEGRKPLGAAELVSGRALHEGQILGA
jgi:methionyl-tRNA formyltransferase